jgi:hypothetical protein
MIWPAPLRVAADGYNRNAIGSEATSYNEAEV